VMENMFAVATFNNLTFLHHYDLVGDIRHHRQVMAEENHTDIAYAL